MRLFNDKSIPIKCPVSVSQLKKKKKKKEGREKKEDKEKGLGEGRNRKIYLRDLKELNTKPSSELNVGLENLNVLALCIDPFIYKYVITLLNIKVNTLNFCNEGNASNISNDSRNTAMNPFLKH